MDDVASFLHRSRDDLCVADGLLDHLEVAACGKGVARAGDDRHPYLRVLPQVQPHAAQFVVQREPCGVEHLRAVHRQEGDAVILFDQEVLVAAVINHFKYPGKKVPSPSGRGLG